MLWRAATRVIKYKVSLIARGEPVTDMLVSYIHGCAAGVLIMPTSETYCRHIRPAFLHFLETKSLEETHDIADASLFVLMTLEETRWYPIFSESSLSCSNDVWCV